MALAQQQHGVVAPQQARATGYSKGRMLTLQRQGFIRPHLGCLLLPSCTKRMSRADAHALTLRLGAGTVVTGAAAAQILGCDGDWATRFCATTPMAYASVDRNISVDGAKILRCQFDGRVNRRGELTLADQMTALLDTLEVVPYDLRADFLDHCLQRRWLKVEDAEQRLSGRCAGRGGRRSSAAQRQALRHVREGTHSAAERLMRRALLRAGLRAGGAEGTRGTGGAVGWHANHSVQVPVASEAGKSHSLAQIDFAWPDCRLALEVDGRAFHSAAAAFENDRARRNNLQLGGWTVVHATWKSLTDDPGAVAGMVLATLKRLRSCGARAPGL